MAEVVLSTEAQKQLDALPMHLNAQVQKIIERLSAWPRLSGAKPLRGVSRGDAASAWETIGCSSWLWKTW